MNKNTLIGTLLICALLFGYTWVSQPSPEQIEARRHYLDSINQAQREAIVDSVAQAELAALKSDSAVLSPMDSAAVAALDSLNTLRAIQTYGALAEATMGENQVVTIHNDVLSLELSTKGGQISRATLMQFDDYMGNNLELFNADNNELYYTINTPKGSFNTDKFYFQPVKVTQTEATMQLKSADGALLEFVYRLPEADSYLVEYSIHTLHADQLVNDRTVVLNWRQSLPRTEKGQYFESRYSELYYKYSGQSTNNLSSMSPDDETLDARLTWFAFQNQFFSTMLVTNDLFTAGRLRSEPIKEEVDTTAIKKYYAENLEFEIDTKLNEQVIPMCLYLGPKDYWRLSDMNDQAAAFVGKQNENLKMEKSYYLGWPIVRQVNQWIIIPIFHALEKVVSNYGIIILLLTLFIKLITLPMTYKSYKSSAKMRIAQRMPEVQAINEKYPDQEQAMEKQQALMAFYSKIGVSPAGGCIPMLIQWPVLFALFYFFPTSIEFRHQPFLWADDLSTYDAFLTWDANIPVVNWIFGHHLSLFCVLMTVTNLLYTWIMQKQNPAQQSMPGMKLMMYGMPLMFLFFLNNYSSGLSYYYFLSTLLGIIITYGIRWSMNEDKILAQMKENLKKPAKAQKANGWVARLQEVQRQQQEQLKKQREEQLRKQRR